MARWRYDEGLRPTHQYVEASGSEVLVMRTVYGESLANAEVLNLRGQAYRVYDGAGVQTAVAYDFKGGLLAAERQLAVDVTQALDWSALGELEDVTDLENAATAMLETEVFQTSSTFDALGRARTQTTPDGTVVRLAYNEAALLESVSANVRGSASETAFVSNVDYDAQGRRSLIAYGNGTETAYAYDEVTQRLTRMRTTDATRTFQDLTYTYDVVGNIVEIGDGAQDNVYFGGTVVTARQRYEYDALYRLTDAEGREHIGQNAAQPSEFGANASAHPQDGTAMRGYAEAYVYDVVGNILEMQHAAAGGNWTRRYQYAGNGNRLQATSLPGDAAGQHSATYGYDVHGNMSSMPHLSAVRWNYADQMRSADLGGGGTVYFVYDGAGQRVRKVSVNQAGTQSTERIYLGAYELYRERTGGSIQLERETLHIADDGGRMCDVETRTVESGSAVGTPTTHHRYQYSNHLGSASLELTQTAEVISYEEYHPYGTSSYRAVNSSIDVSERTYRYTGKERDEETGLGYHGARYYACWLGRWTASDPIGLGDGVNRYAYVSGRPVRLTDPTGTAGDETNSHFILKHQAAVGKTQKNEGEGFGFILKHADAVEEAQRSKSKARTSNSQKDGSVGFGSPLTALRARGPAALTAVPGGDVANPAARGGGETRSLIVDAGFVGVDSVVLANFAVLSAPLASEANLLGHGYVLVTEEAELASMTIRASPVLTATALAAEVVGEAEAIAGGEPPGTHLPAGPRKSKNAAGVIDVPRQGPGDFAGEAGAAVAKNKPKVRVGAAVEASVAGAGGRNLRQSVETLKKLGVDRASRRAFLEGKLVAGETKDVISFAQVQGDNLTVGIFQILKGANGPREFLALQKNAVELARSLGLKNVRVGGTAFTNKALKQSLIDRGFEVGSIQAPPPFDPSDTIEFISKVFSVS